jgi:hAT family protein
MKIWINMDGGDISSAKLISQIRSFYLKEIEFDYPFSIDDNVLTWWRMCNPVSEEENHIQKLALKILSITPHNAGCERVFSILGWFTNKRRTK